MKKGPEENGFVKTPNSLLRRILEKDSDYTHVAMYLSSRARFSFEESNDGLKRGQLRTSKRQIAASPAITGHRKNLEKLTINWLSYSRE